MTKSLFLPVILGGGTVLAGTSFAVYPLISNRAAGLPVQQTLSAELVDQVAVANELFGEDGFIAAQTPESGTLTAGNSIQFQIRPEAGARYVAAGMCSSGCSDLDLVVRDSSDDELDADFLLDDFPMVSFVAPNARPLAISVIMKACDGTCDWAVQLYAEATDAATPVRDLELDRRLLDARVEIAAQAKDPDLGAEENELMGVGPLNEPQHGMLRMGEHSVISIELMEGFGYSIQGSCDADCSDMDLTLMDPVQRVVLAEDDDLDAVPVISFVPSRSGEFDVLVSVPSCSIEPCGWDVIVAQSTSGALTGGSSESMEVFLRAGIRYQLWGLCDADCSDVDLRLDDLSGRTLAEDYLTDDIPLLLYQPEVTGQFNLTVDMASCNVDPCIWTVFLSPTR